jgi:hypothetical protein
LLASAITTCIFVRLAAILGLNNISKTCRYKAKLIKIVAIEKKNKIDPPSTQTLLKAANLGAKRLNGGIPSSDTNAVI